MRYNLTARLRRLYSDEGGWITAALTGLGALGSLFGKGAESSAKGRQAEGQLLMQQDALKNQQYGIGQNAQMDLGQLDLQRKNFSEGARGGRAKQALLADLLMNFQPQTVSVPGIRNAQISGGPQIGEGGKAAMAELMKQALAAQLAGDQFQGGQILQAPQMNKLPKASGWEKTMGVLGTLGSIGGVLGSAFGKQGGGGGAVPSVGATAGIPGNVMPGGEVPLPDLSEYIQPRNYNPDIYKNIQF